MQCWNRGTVNLLCSQNARKQKHYTKGRGSNSPTVPPFFLYLNFCHSMGRGRRGHTFIHKRIHFKSIFLDKYRYM